MVNERLTAAAEEKTIVVYEEELNRQSGQLDDVWKPEIKLHRIELPQQHVCKEEEVFSDQHLCVEERSSSLDQEAPEPPQIKKEQEELCSSDEEKQLVLKQETDTFMLTSTCGENDHSEDQTLNWSAVEEKPLIYLPVISSAVSEANSDHQLLSHSSHETVRQDQKGGKHGDPGSSRNAQVKSHFLVKRGRDVRFSSHLTVHMRTHTELPQQHVCKEEEVFSDQHLCIEERSSSLDQEAPEPPQIKKEQEELCSSDEEKQLVLKQETDTFMLTSTCEENDQSEDQTLNWSAVEEKPLIYLPVISSAVSEANSDHQLLSYSSHETMRQDQKGGKHGDPGSTRNAQPQEQSPHHKSSSDINKVDVPTMSTTHCNTHTGKKSFKCDTCDKTFMHKRNLWRHLLTHASEKQYTCQFCGKDFGRNDHLTTHVKIHTDEKPFSCKACGKAFRCNNHLTIHMRTHTGEKPFTCKTCGKAFRRNSHLTVHLRAHTGEKPCTCKTCGKGFSDASNLNMHMRIHTGEKPYPCKTCGRAFRFKGDLKKHENRPPKRCIAAAQRFQLWPSQCLN